MKNLNRAIYVLVFTVLALVLPIANPELAATIGGVFDEPLQLIAQIIGGVAADISVYEADIATLIFGSGVSMPLVFGLTELLKRAPQLANQPAQRIATVLSLIVFGVLFVSRKWGYEIEFDNATQLAVMAITLFGGVGASQFGASKLYNKLAPSDFAMAQPRLADSPSDSGSGDGQSTSA